MTSDINSNAIGSTFEAAKELVKAYLAVNPMPAENLPELLISVHDSLLRIAEASVVIPSIKAPAQVSIAQVAPEVVKEVEQPCGKPAVPVEESITPDGEWIICLEDGSKHKMMKRYLRRIYQMSPEEYRARWGLPDNYPMTAPSYSTQKRNEALTVGLGTNENKQGRNTRRAFATI
jgi:predicted transcriptional regulator